MRAGAVSGQITLSLKYFKEEDLSAIDKNIKTSCSISLSVSRLEVLIELKFDIIQGLG